MNFVLLLLAATISGVIGGMGMGGGTLLIPILTLLFDLEQDFSQTINLVAFIPMAIVALVIHHKNGVIKTDGIGFIILFAIIFSVGGSLLTKIVKANIQTKLFGVFLIILSIFQCVMVSKSSSSKKMDLPEKNDKKYLKSNKKSK